MEKITHEPLVSIIIPVYNVSQYIEKCLLSVLNQTYQNLEIILVNDCTPDNSMDLINNMLLKYPNEERIKIIKHKINRGLSAARNSGITASNGEYIYFLDSDDEIFEHTISSLIKIAIKDKPDFVVGGHLASTQNHYFTPDIHKLKNIRSPFYSFLNNWWRCEACNKLISKTFLIENNLFFKESIYHEDVLWSFNLALKTKSMSICYQYTHFYYIRENSISRQKKNIKNVNDLCFIIEEIYKIIKLNKIPFTLSLKGFLLKYVYTIYLKATQFEYDETLLKRIKKLLPKAYYTTILKYQLKFQFGSLLLLLPTKYSYKYLRKKATKKGF